MREAARASPARIARDFGLRPAARGVWPVREARRRDRSGQRRPEGGQGRGGARALRQGGGEAAGRSGRRTSIAAPALYALSRFDEAGQEFLRATEAKDPALKAAAFYNLGNAFFKKEKFKEAVWPTSERSPSSPTTSRPSGTWRSRCASRRIRKTKTRRIRTRRTRTRKKDDKKEGSRQEGQKKDDKKDDQKKDQDKKDQKDKDQKDQKDKQDQKPQEKPSTPKEQEKIQSVLDNLERSSKDLEKERAKARAVRRAPPERDW